MRGVIAMKIVINRCYGGYGLSEEACKMLNSNEYDYDDDRTNTKLIEVVEALGDKANTRFSMLRIVEIPDEATDYMINDYDGVESIIYVVDGKLRFA